MTDSLSSLGLLVPGFDDAVRDAQATFRVMLDALARPGTPGTIDVPLAEEALARWPASAFAALLTLADFSTPVWLQQRDEALVEAIRFHTGAPLADSPAAAAFAYIADAASLPAPDAFSLGTPEEPQASATLIICVESFEGGRPLTLTGPGIQSRQAAAPAGLPDAFWQARAALAPAAPCGIDCYFVCGRSIMGIARTTRVELN